MVGRLKALVIGLALVLIMGASKGCGDNGPIVRKYVSHTGNHILEVRTDVGKKSVIVPRQDYRVCAVGEQFPDCAN